ncbi:MAG: ABC transporter substrate-binding protein [Pseudomonadota bacterium]
MSNRTAVCRPLLAGLAALFMQCCQAADHPVRVQLNQAVQPFALPASGSGLQADIIRAAFATQSVPTEFVFLPGARSWLEYKAGRIDAVTNAKPGSELDIVLTHWPVALFQNQAITLKRKNIEFKSIGELGKYRVIAFQNASKFLGPEYAIMARLNPNYVEQATMPSFLLRNEATDVIVSQADIFRFNLIENAARLGFKPDFEQFEYHPIFEKGNDYWYGFRTEAMRDQFERGIAAIYKSGEIDKIFAHYQKQFGTSRELFIHLDCRFLKKNRPPACAQEAQH